MPPSGARRSCTSSMKFRMRKMPRPLDLSRLSGSGGRRQLGIETLALIADENRKLRDSSPRRALELDEHVFRRVVAVAVFDGVDDRLADRHADPVHGVVVETRRVRPM